MSEMKFVDYGILKWLEPKEYYRESWAFVNKAIGFDGAVYTLVKNDEEIRYTEI